MYLTYAEYKSMGGTLSENTFIDYERQVESIIDYATFNRIRKCAELPEPVIRLTYHLINMIQKKSEALSLGNAINGRAVGGYIKSQSNDGVAVTYSGMNSTDVWVSANSEIQNDIKLYLNGVTNDLGQKLLYRGLYPGE